MLYLASIPEGLTTSFREIARKMDIPEEYLAKILKTLVKQKLVRSTRGSHGGYSLALPASQISFLDVIQAVEGPVSVNVCTEKDHGGCHFTGACTMYSVWRQGQERMLEVYRGTKLDKLAMRSLTHRSPVVGLTARS
jgi:Rrf2 family protein